MIQRSGAWCEQCQGELRERDFRVHITRLLAFIDTCPERFPVESVLVKDFPDFGSSHLNEETVRNADLSRSILLAEIAPGRFNVIDGNHRLARARRESVQMIPARRVLCPDHVPFLISDWAYEKYVEYWNSKFEDMTPAKARRRYRKASLEFTGARVRFTALEFSPVSERLRPCCDPRTLGHNWKSYRGQHAQETLTGGGCSRDGVSGRRRPATSL